MKHIDYSLQLSSENPVAWAVTKKATLLDEEINAWLGAIKKSGKLNVLYNRYYKNSYITSLHNSKYYKLKNGVISSFDPIIKKEARAIGWTGACWQPLSTKNPVSTQKPLPTLGLSA